MTSHVCIKLPSVFLCPCGYKVQGENRKVVMCRRLHKKKCSGIEKYSKQELAWMHRKHVQAKANSFNTKIYSKAGYYNTPDICFSKEVKPSPPDPYKFITKGK